MAEKSQLEKANEALLDMKPNITSTDRREALKNGFGIATVKSYLSGNGQNLDTMVALLQFFRKRIEDREKLIA